MSYVEELPLGLGSHRMALCLGRLGPRNLKYLRFSPYLQTNMGRLPQLILLDARRRHDATSRTETKDSLSLTEQQAT